MKQINELPFFEVKKDEILPVGMIEYCHENSLPCYWVEQILFLYKDKLYIIESLDDEDKTDLAFLVSDVEDIGKSYLCANRDFDKIEYTFFLMDKPEPFYIKEKESGTLLLRFDSDRWNGIEFSNSNYWNFNGWYATSNEYLNNDVEFQNETTKEDFIKRITQFIK